VTRRAGEERLGWWLPRGGERGLVHWSASR
jgi:hypothetical protein